MWLQFEREEDFFGKGHLFINHIKHFSNMRTKELLRSIVNIYEIGIGCGVYTAQITVERFERDDYFKGTVIKGTIYKDKEYLYLWSDKNNTNPLFIEPEVMIINEEDEIIYIWEI